MTGALIIFDKKMTLDEVFGDGFDEAAQEAVSERLGYEYEFESYTSFKPATNPDPRLGDDVANQWKIIAVFTNIADQTSKNISIGYNSVTRAFGIIKQSSY